MDTPAGVSTFRPVPELFPFESRWFDSSVGPVHYVDEGEGRPLLLLHGNPDWSFLYRHLIAALRGSFRCIALDYPGFGLSVHPEGYGYTPAEHAAVVSELVERLDLTDAIVMGQDWGGPIGMEVASRMPERVSGLVMGNTWYWPAKTRMFRAFSRVMSSAPAQWLIVQRNAFVRPLMSGMIKADLSAMEMAHYLDVVPTPQSRRGIAEFPKQILASGAWLSALERRAARTLSGKQMLLVFGRRDPAFGSESVSARWLRVFPGATLVELPEAGHYIQEDAPREIADAIRAEFA